MKILREGYVLHNGDVVLRGPFRARSRLLSSPSQLFSRWDASLEYQLFLNRDLG